ncbi:DUF1348 family protein [Streptomyces sp. NPDC060030]|uniref:DUF1348 family protein n=1 Tax=Streptomyces sp. NPDC060030 TaxID=3347042 RepID=UPI003675FAC3
MGPGDVGARVVRRVEDAWNTRAPERVALVHTPDARRRNRPECVTGREVMVGFLTRKWARELDCRPVRELWAHDGSRIAVRFAYEGHDDAGRRYRAHGNEDWECDDRGLVRVRDTSINDDRSSGPADDSTGRRGVAGPSPRVTEPGL